MKAEGILPLLCIALMLRRLTCLSISMEGKKEYCFEMNLLADDLVVIDYSCFGILENKISFRATLNGVN